MIDYPLMGGTDSDRYTDHNYEGGYDLYGTPFLDSRNAVDFSDFFSLVFGHDMNNSAMFGSLDDFLQESAFADLSDGVLLLPDERYRLEVTASIAATCPAQELIDQIMTADAAEQPQLLEQLLEMAAVKKDDVTVSEEDHWVMLSTLDYADEKNDNGTPSMLPAEAKNQYDIKHTGRETCPVFVELQGRIFSHFARLTFSQKCAIISLI